MEPKPGKTPEEVIAELEGRSHPTRKGTSLYEVSNLEDVYGNIIGYRVTKEKFEGEVVVIDILNKTTI